MVETNLIADLGLVFFEIGVILFLSLTVSSIFRKIGIPAVLGLLIGGIAIGIFSNFRGYVFSSDFDSFRIYLTEIALGFIAYDIGNELDLHIWITKGKKYTYILLNSLFPFLIVTLGLWLIFDLELWLSMMFGAIATTGAPAVTSDILGDYHAEGSLSQAIIFILAIDSVFSIIFINIAISSLVSTGTGIGLIINILFSIFSLVAISSVISISGATIFFILLSKSTLEEKSIVEWILGISLIIIGASLVFNGSVILSMLIFGILLKTMETKFEMITVPVLQLEILLIPVVLMFYVLMGLIIDVDILFSSGIFIVVIYFILRFVSKSFSIFLTEKFSNVEDDIKGNLHLCLITQAGIALALTGLAYNKLLSLGFVEEAKLLVSVVGISIIISQLIGPIMLRYGIKRSKLDNTKFTLLSAVEEPLVDV